MESIGAAWWNCLKPKQKVIVVTSVQRSPFWLEQTAFPVYNYTTVSTIVHKIQLSISQLFRVLWICLVNAAGPIFSSNSLGLSHKQRKHTDLCINMWINVSRTIDKGLIVLL